MTNKCPPAFTVTNRAPAVKTAPVRLADPTSHIHRCPSCGTEWSHSNSSAGDTAKHTCPTCRKVLPLPWWPSERGVRIERRKVAYRDVVERVKAGESLTVAVGTDDEADCVVDRVPDTEPGLWRCFLQDGKPVMERVDVPKTVYQSVPQNFLSVPGSR